MTLAERMLQEFERTFPMTRRHLERVPAGQLSWKPSEKSMSVGQLALHIAKTPGEIGRMAREDGFEIPDFSKGFAEPASVEEILQAADESATKVREALSGVSDERMAANIDFLRAGKVAMSWPRELFLRDIMLNHTYHHRGQLSVYLRLLGVPVPVSFGPTADEQMPPPPPQS